MKKLLLLAAAAVATGAFAADYTVASPYANASVTEGKTCIFDIVLANDDVIAGLEKAGQTINDWRTNDETNFLYIWNNLEGAPTTYPGVGYSDLAPGESYVDLAVKNADWSGGGFFMTTTSTKHWNSNTRIHIAARTDATAPMALNFTIQDIDAFTLGAGEFPSAGPQLTGEWVAIDLSFAELIELNPSFSFLATENYSGNTVSFLAGNVPGTTFCLDAIYFYTEVNDEGGEEPGGDEPGIENPQYPYMASSPFPNINVTEGKVSIFDVVLANDNVMSGLENAGQKVNDWRTNETTNFLYIWDNTFTSGASVAEGVGFDNFVKDEYVSLNVGSVGWSGAGFVTNGVNTNHWTDETHLHIAARTNGTSPVSVGFIVSGNNEQSARVALGTDFNDNGTVFKSVGPRISDEWMAIDISFAELKELNPNFVINLTESWTQGENIVSILGGGSTGQNICLDAIYFYTLTDEQSSGMDEIAISGVSETQVYDLSGRLVMSGSNLNLNDLNNGIYVVKSGKDVKKIIK